MRERSGSEWCALDWTEAVALGCGDAEESKTREVRMVFAWEAWISRMCSCLVFPSTGLASSLYYNLVALSIPL